MEKHHGAPNDALKLFPLAQIGTDQHSDPQVSASNCQDLWMKIF